MIMPILPHIYMQMYSYDLNNNPVLFNILKSYVCFENDDLKDYTQIIENSRQYLFTDYPLSEKVNKAQFERDIITRFMNRRIEQETYVMFKLKFNAKLRSIMPKYNILFDGLSQNFYEQNSGTTEMTTDVFSENVKENATDKRLIDTEDDRTISSTNISDRRNSDTPQNALTDVRNGTYISVYNYDTDTINTTDNNNIHTTDNDTLNKNQDTNNDRNIEKNIIKTDTINRDTIYLNIEQYGHIMEMIYNDLEVCFLSTD